MVPPSAIRVLGRPAFHDTALSSDGTLAYLGAAWRKDVACAGYGVAVAADLPAGELIDGVPGVDPARKDALIALLGIDRGWRLPRLSDGQRRRVQVRRERRQDESERERKQIAPPLSPLTPPPPLTSLSLSPLPSPSPSHPSLSSITRSAWACSSRTPSCSWTR